MVAKKFTALCQVPSTQLRVKLLNGHYLNTLGTLLSTCIYIYIEHKNTIPQQFHSYLYQLRVHEAQNNTETNKFMQRQYEILSRVTP